MSQQTKKTFQLTILAAAVLSLTACSSAPKMSDFDLGRMGDGLGKIGDKSLELGAVAWDKTVDLLYIGERPEKMDDVDLALMKDDANIDMNTDLDGVEISAVDDAAILPLGEMDGSIELSEMDMSSDLLDDDTFGDIEAQLAANGEVVVLEPSDLPETANIDLLAADASFGADEQLIDGQATTIETVATNDMTHSVGAGETLWDIAKMTTGDANNWHIIADINNLAPDASVRVGQNLIIPADMVKPSYAQPTLAAAQSADQLETEVMLEAETMAEAVELAPADMQAEQGALVSLNIPENTLATDKIEMDEVVAVAETVQPAASPADIMTDATMLKVAEGETLWDFSKRTTGDATNWKLIADKNLLTDKQIAAIRPGQKIFVPTDMVRQRDANGVLIAKEDEVLMPTNAEALEASAAVLAGTNEPALAAAIEGDVKIVEAAFQGADSSEPVTAESLSNEAAMAVAENNNGLSKVMVSGTYYPKAVYNEADFSSSLLMRVSPGTKLLVSKAIGPWLQVETDQGTGYLHSRDIK